jgi:hypothetical protein
MLTFPVIKHIRAEFHSGPLVVDKFFLQLASGAEIHHLVDLALQRRPSHDLSGIRNDSEPEDFHFPGLRVYCKLARGNIHGI